MPSLFKQQKWIIHYDVTFYCVLFKRLLYTMVILIFFIHTVISIRQVAGVSVCLAHKSRPSLLHSLNFLNYLGIFSLVSNVAFYGASWSVGL